MMADEVGIEIAARIVKADEDQRIVYGWASVIEEGGEVVTDAQGDQIEPAEIEKALAEFMGSARLAKAMHEGDGIGEVLYAFPLTRDIQKALGLSADRAGAIIGMKVHDDAVWARVKSGELGAFSIGCVAVREPVE